MFIPMLSNVRRVLADPDVAIDLGTANTRLYARGRGLVADEPSIVKLRPDTGLVEAVGARAARKSVYGTAPGVVAPLRAGVVADVGAATALLTPLLRRVRRFGMIKPRVLACVPTDARENERDAVIEATRRAGASSVALAPEPLAAAIGSGMDVSSEYARMLVDIGDGVTDIAVIRSGSLVTTAAIRTACSDLLRAVRRSVAQRHGVELYQREAERLIRTVGAGSRKNSLFPYIVAGADCQTGLLRRVPVSGQEVAEAINQVIAKIIGFIGRTVRELPPELACEVIESGISLTGGGACLRGVPDLIAAETSLAVYPARDPMRAVINGARQMLAVGAVTGLWNN
ncbi:MAG TPA: rod shape-determining protein [Blastocatellia bacterium]|nr:rod shape-determining protein [Blastocatellia bacterium]